MSRALLVDYPPARHKPVASSETLHHKKEQMYQINRTSVLMTTWSDSRPLTQVPSGSGSQGNKKVDFMCGAKLQDLFPTLLRKQAGGYQYRQEDDRAGFGRPMIGGNARPMRMGRYSRAHTTHHKVGKPRMFEYMHICHGIEDCHMRIHY